MVSYEDLQKANEQIQTMEVKGNAYASVAERIKAFRKLYPEGFICTDLLSNENGVCIIKTTVGFMNEKGEKQVLGTGIAYEKEGSSLVNKTSYIENCETSSCGRALGMCGLGIYSDVASAEEVQTAQLQQDALKPITAEKKKALIKSCQEDGIPESYICELYGVTEINELTEAKFVNLMSNWDKMKAKYNERKNS